MTGWLMALLLLSFIVLAHEAGHFLAAKAVGVRVDVFSIGFGPGIGRRIGETKYRIGIIPLGGYIKPDEDGLAKLSIARRAIVLVAGVVANILLAFLIMAFAFMIGISEQAPVVGSVVPDSPAAICGVEPGDTLVEIGGIKIKSWEDIAPAVNRSGGKAVDVSLRRNEKLLHFRMRPERRTLRNALGLPEERWTLGLSWNGQLAVQSHSPTAAAKSSAKFLGRVLSANTQGLAAIGSGRLEAREALLGPVGVVRISEEAYKLGWESYFMIAAIISLMVGLTNLLPIPILDGGHLLFLGFEAVGLAMPAKVSNGLELLSLALLLSIFAWATFWDIARLLR